MDGIQTSTETIPDDYSTNLDEVIENSHTTSEAIPNINSYPTGLFQIMDDNNLTSTRTILNEEIRNGYSTNLDELVDIRLRMAIFILSVCVMSFNWMCFVALSRTRHTPRTARFLSLALLIFDNTASASLTIRRFVSAANYNFALQLLSLGFVYLTYVNIALMSLERLVVFQWPNFYLRRITPQLSKRVAITVWSVYFMMWTFECVQCYLKVKPMDPPTEDCIRMIIGRFVVMTFLLANLLSCVCLIKIGIIIVKQNSKRIGKKKSIQAHKSTFVVLLCVLNAAMNSACGFILISTVKEYYDRRVASDVQTIINGFLDTFIYVLWYKECRLELLKMWSRVFPSLNRNIENMRMVIFEIKTYRTKCQT